MKYRVESTPTAEREVDGILAWLFERSPQGALHWFAAWKSATAFLSSNPFAAAIAPENSDHAEELRHWTFKSEHGKRYRVLFIVRGEVVYITNVRGTGQRLLGKSEVGKPNQ